MSGHIVVVGSLNMDLVARAERHPEIGETILGSDFKTFPGGKGANQAVAAARLGAPVKMVGRVGQDPFGEALLQNLQQAGVDTTLVTKDPAEPTGVALIIVDATGQNSNVVVPGANGRLSPKDISSCESVFEGAAALVLQLECPLPAINRAIELAHKHGVKVILNPAPVQPVDKRFLAQIDYLIPNQSELALMTGVNSLDAAIDCLRDLGVPRLVVTLGKDGAVVVGERQEVYLDPYQVEAVDTTAAGDAFVGAFAVALAEGLSSLHAASWGNAAGALSVTRAGAQPSLPTRKELEQFMGNKREKARKGKVGR